MSFDIPNRYSLWREPHTKKWGIGFLPRRWTELERIKNQSLPSLRTLARGAFGDSFEIRSMFVRFEASGYRASRFVKALAAILARVERVPLVRNIVRFFQPGFEVVAWKPAAENDQACRGSGQSPADH